MASIDSLRLAYTNGWQPLGVTATGKQQVSSSIYLRLSHSEIFFKFSSFFLWFITTEIIPHLLFLSSSSPVAIVVPQLSANAWNPSFSFKIPSIAPPPLFLDASPYFSWNTPSSAKIAAIATYHEPSPPFFSIAKGATVKAFATKAARGDAAFTTTK